MFNFDPLKKNAGLWSAGPVPGQLYYCPGKNQGGGTTYPAYDPPRPVQPGPTICTSALGMKFNGGVLLAADNLVSYGSLARFQNVQRVFNVNNKCLVGAMGDFADFQSLKQSIDQKIIDDFCHDDSIEMRADAMYNWLTRIMYNRRSNINPLFVELVVGGLDTAGEPFLGHIDTLGRAYTDALVATGLAKHLILPYMREFSTEKGIELSQKDALECIKKSMELLYYRDCRACSSYTVAICTKAEGSKILGPLRVDEDWEVQSLVRGF